MTFAKRVMYLFLGLSIGLYIGINQAKSMLEYAFNNDLVDIVELYYLDKTAYLDD